MAKSAFTKVMWVGRATVFLVGLAVILALVLGAATTALGATGANLILGKPNAAETPTSLVSTLSDAVKPAVGIHNKSGGPALNLGVASDKAPIRVNASAGTATNLSADELDGKDSSEFLGKTEKAQDADALDGLNSTDLARSVHATMEPTYGTPMQANRQHLLTLPTGDRLDWGCSRFGDNYYVNDLGLSAGGGGTRRTVIVQESSGTTWVSESYGGVFGGHGNNNGTRSVDTYTLRTTTMSSPSPFVATVEVVVHYRQDTCHISAQGTVSGGV